MAFNPLNDVLEEPAREESTSSLINDVIGVCPKCKKPFGEGLVNDDTVFYCVNCRVSQPIPV